MFCLADTSAIDLAKALEDALEYADSADGVTKLEDQLGDFGTALSDILSKLNSLDGGSASAATEIEDEGGGGRSPSTAGASSTVLALAEPNGGERAAASVSAAQRADGHSSNATLESDETRTAAAIAELED